MSNPTDRLVELFLKSAVPEGGNPDTLELTPEAIERGVEATQKMLLSDDAIQMGIAGSIAPTFVCIAMAMEEKPKMMWAACRCYEQSLKFLKHLPGSWERIVVLQQLGMVCLRHDRANDAVAWLTDCADQCCKAEGHPRDAVLFGGNFSTPQTRIEFMTSIEKMRAQSYYKLGDMNRANEHLEESKRLEAVSTGDAVERAAAATTSASSRALAGASPIATSVSGDIAQLWAQSVGDPVRLKTYRFQDEGPTVLLTLDLNDHLGIGEEGSNLIDSLKQFRVKCHEAVCDIRLRIRVRDLVQEFRLLLDPLVHKIIPEDTVPRLKGRQGKRRLEVKLFKREKDCKWQGDLVKSVSQDAQKKSKQPAPKGSHLNPLTPEELAKLPSPSGIGGENLPSSFRAAAKAAASVEASAVKKVEATSLAASAIVTTRKIEPEAEPPVIAALEEMD